ncbi:MAG: ATP-binding protein [Phycisphaerae bacterium]
MNDGLVIAVASGKGGTGKTTIATNLALCLSDSGRSVRYLDCDVEEPNGHIFLKPQINEKIIVTAPVPQVDKNKCIGCGKCGKVCQYGAIVHLGDTNVLTFEQLCHSCAGCWLLCPVEAISQKQIEVGEIEMGQSQKVRFDHGRLKIGNVRSPYLIKQLKKNIDKNAVNILDVPPGTSCPVVESLKGCDFVLLVSEPTPFGLNDLKLAVDLVRQMSLPFAVAINRNGCGDEQLEEYCINESINIIMKLPHDRKIAEAYSSGQMIVETLSEYKKEFESLSENILQRLKS